MTDIRMQAARAALEAALRGGHDTSKHRAVIRQLEAELAPVAQAEAAEREADRKRAEEAIQTSAVRLSDESNARVRAMLETLDLEFPF